MNNEHDFDFKTFYNGGRANIIVLTRNRNYAHSSILKFIFNIHTDSYTLWKRNLHARIQLFFCIVPLPLPLTTIFRRISRINA